MVRIQTVYDKHTKNMNRMKYGNTHAKDVVLIRSFGFTDFFQEKKITPATIIPPLPRISFFFQIDSSELP